MFIRITQPGANIQRIIKLTTAFLVLLTVVTLCFSYYVMRFGPHSIRREADEVTTVVADSSKASTSDINDTKEFSPEETMEASEEAIRSVASAGVKDLSAYDDSCYHVDWSGQLADIHPDARYFQSMAKREVFHPRKFYFLGEQLAFDQADALQRLLNETQSKGQVRHAYLDLFNDGLVPPDSQGCALNKHAGEFQKCLKSMFADATDRDALIVVAERALFPWTEDVAAIWKVMQTTTPAIQTFYDTIEKHFPGEIIVHSILPISADNEPMLNRANLNMWSLTHGRERITFFNTHSYVISHLHDDSRKLNIDINLIMMHMLECRYRRDVVARAYARLEERERQQCGGSWWHEYAEFHRRALLKLEDNPRKAIEKDGLKVLMYQPNLSYFQGFADYLAGLENAFLLALCTQRVLLVEWSPFTDLFAPRAHIQWKYRPEMLPEDFQSRRLEFIHDEGLDWSKMVAAIENPATPIVKIHMNRANSYGFLTKGGKCAAKTKLKLHNTFGCVISMLGRPVPGVLAPHAYLLDRMLTSPLVGVHFRFGDNTMQIESIYTRTINEHPFEGLVRRMKNFMLPFWYNQSKVHPSKWPAVFLMSDSADFKNAAKHNTRIQVFTTDIAAEHVAKSGIDHWHAYSQVLAEWFLLSMCEMHALDPDSGLSRTAYAYALSERSAFYSRIKQIATPGTGKGLVPARVPDMARLGANL